jgi:hypothetical protein
MELTSGGLSRTDCLALVATKNFGHLALTRRALPTVVPAHYLLHNDHILIHALTGGHPNSWKDGEIVALHVDAFEPDLRAGWSVSLTGAADQPIDVASIEHLPRAPWLADGDGSVIALATDLVWGERYGPRN